ncbi:DUF4249 domain-containing protein [Niastella caeni]|uniref:DUF4249 domain-containing protein n=1 Tax=Niastella caeni TaxID=2569763 RepID=A0A4S8H8V6_9BACT|nr:DUF4249 family protein [Niastella caeni]THU31123.1 DUF4249 domain-containing protein [Niastella caeni]
MERQLKYYSITRFIIFLIFLFSCRKDINISLLRKPQLVLHGYVAVGEPFTVTISRPTDPAIPDSLLPLKNAWVTLNENGVFKDSLLFNAQQKKYVSRSAKAEYGKTYTILAGAHGYPAAEAVATAPEPVPTVAIEHKVKSRITDYGEFLDDVTFSIQDPAGVNNYYIAALYPSDHFYPRLFCVYSTDPVIDRPNAEVLPSSINICINAKGILFNDQSFNGSLKKITISAWPKALETIKDSTGVYKPYLKKYTISKDFYKYFKHISSQDFELGIPYSYIPAIDIGNVTNGYGLFTIYSVTTDSLP